MGRKAARNM